MGSRRNLIPLPPLLGQNIGCLVDPTCPGQGFCEPQPPNPIFDPHFTFRVFAQTRTRHTLPFCEHGRVPYAQTFSASTPAQNGARGESRLSARQVALAELPFAIVSTKHEAGGLGGLEPKSGRVSARGSGPSRGVRVSGCLQLPEANWTKGHLLALQSSLPEFLHCMH